MRVTEVEVVPYALPFARPYVTARGTLERREMALVRLLTDAGLEGLGEAVPLALRGGADLDTVARALRKGTRRLRRADLSDFGGEEPLLAAVDAYVHTVAGRRLPGPAKAAIEMAIFDLAGKASRQAAVVAARSRGGRPGALQRDPRRRQRRPRSPTMPSAGPRAASRPSSSSSAPATTSPRCAPCASGSGPSAKIRVDANGAWTVDEALGVLRMIEPLGIELAEQPVADLGGHGRSSTGDLDPDRRRRERRAGRGRPARRSATAPATWRR